MESAALMRSALLRNILSSLEQPLDPSRTAAIAKQLVDNGLLVAGPNGMQGGIWAPITELQGKLVETVLKHLTKGEASFRPGAAVLLGLVCRQVPARAFLASYGEWAAALQELVRREPGPAPRSAGLRALGDLFTRVREVLEVAGVRRNASGLAGRTLQLATPLLGDADCQLSALAAVRAVLLALPTVARNHTAALERSLAGLLAAPASPTAVRCAAAAALALLPRAAADDAAAWAALIRRVLLSVHTAVDLLFHHGGGGGGCISPASGGAHGLAADGGLGARAREQLEASGPGVADAEGLLGPAGFVGAGGGGGGGTAARPDVALTLQVMVALLQCLVAMVGHGAFSPVPVPAHAVLLLVMRMSKLEPAVLLAPGRVAPSASAQSEVLCRLPDLAVAAWEVLGLTARVVRGGMMPLMALLCRLLGEQLRRIKAGGAGGLAVTMPAAVRSALYRTTATVLRVGGFAAGRYLAAEVCGMLVTELYGLSATQQQEQAKAAALYGNGGGAAAGMGKAGRSPAVAAGGPPAKKAKTAVCDPLAAFDVATAAAAASAVAPVASPYDVEAQKTALEVAETLLQVYGPALPYDLRGQLDALSYHMAAVLTEAAHRVAREPAAAAAARAADVAELRVASTRALVASLAAPAPCRHPFLSEGLQLLATGASGAGGVALAEVCSEGLMAMEALLRPRAAPPPLGVGRAGGGGGADGAQGLHLPRPRLWSMLDPVPPPQLPPPAAAEPAAAVPNQMAVAAVTVPGTAAAAPLKPADERREAAAQPLQQQQPLAAAAAEGYGAAGEGKRAAKTGKAAKSKVAAVAAAAPTPPAVAKEKSALDGEGRTPTPAVMVATASGAAAAAEPRAAKRQKGENGKAAAAAAAPADVAAKVDGAGATATAPAAQAAAPPAAATVPARRPAAAPAAAVLGDESEDSEGSLPEIDSGNDSDSDD